MGDVLYALVGLSGYIAPSTLLVVWLGIYLKLESEGIHTDVYIFVVTVLMRLKKDPLATSTHQNVDAKQWTHPLQKLLPDSRPLVYADEDR